MNDTPAENIESQPAAPEQPAAPAAEPPANAPAPTTEPIPPTPPLESLPSPAPAAETMVADVKTSPQPESALPAPASVEPRISPKLFREKALAAIQFRKRAKLEKIMAFAVKKGSITNNHVEKLLRVSDATATRYLDLLVRQNRLRNIGVKSRR
ncbi:hypothetical protein HY504_02625 [Candidatus Wolfebacteria bacterium]|nr:hypothetical protein [Candidatus Wolfebacteria bacterium]